MTEPVASPVRSKTGVKLARWIAAGILGLAVAVGLASTILRGPKPEISATSSPTLMNSPALRPLAKPNSMTVRLSDPVFHPWPPKPEVIGPPAGMPNPVKDRPKPETAKIAPTSAMVAREPLPPSLEELKKESARTGDELAGEDARAILLDEKRSSAIKLAIIDKLRAQDPQDAIPILVAFLEAPGTPAGNYTKPTAVKVLADLQDPRAEEALFKLAQTSPDELVRLTIAALQAKEKSR